MPLNVFNKSSGLMGLIASFAFGILLPLILYFSFTAVGLFGNQLAGDSLNFVMLGILVFPLVIGLFLIHAAIGFEKPKIDVRPRVILAVVSGILSGILVGHFFSQAVILLLNQAGLWRLAGTVELHPVEFSVESINAIVYQLFVILYMPILEEIWYRELTLKQSIKVMGIVPGLLLTSSLFSLSHIFSMSSLQHLVSTSSSIFVTGMVLGILRLKFGLTVSIAAHCFQNYLGHRFQILNNPIELIWLMVFAILGVLTFVICTFFLREKIDSDR